MNSNFDYPQFIRMFSSNLDCLEYLHNQKWKSGYICRKCGSKTAKNSSASLSKRCTACGYDESPTAHTFFHKLKIPIKKAFLMTYRIMMSKKGLSALSLSSEFNVNPNTAWAFKKKLQAALEANLKEPVSSKISRIFRKLDGLNISFRGKGCNGFQQLYLIIGCTKEGEYRLIPGEMVIDLPSSEKLTPSELFEGHYVSEGKDLMMWHLKSWITGTHHHCSRQHLSGYVAEFIFKYNARKNRKMLWEKLINALVSSYNSRR